MDWHRASTGNGGFHFFSFSMEQPTPSCWILDDVLFPDVLLESEINLESVFTSVEDIRPLKSKIASKRVQNELSKLCASQVYLFFCRNFVVFLSSVAVVFSTWFSCVSDFFTTNMEM